MANLTYLHPTTAPPMRLTRVQALAREKARLEDAIRRTDAEIAALEEELQRWQALHQAVHALYAMQEATLG